MAASLEPVVEQPMAPWIAGACQRSATMRAQRASISAVWGYLSLSSMFLSMHRSIRAWTSSSTQVWQKVARFWRELPSSISSSRIAANTARGLCSWLGKWLFGRVTERSVEE